MDADDLYGLPLDRFVAERGVLAKALRAAGERERAAQVAARRKPSVAAWAVNQLVRTQHDDVAELYAAGDALRDAQAALLAGRGDGRALRAAGEQERAAVQRLVETARGLLTSDGHELSETVVERVADTLHAAALDEHAREQVREGRLERELRHVGLGLGEGSTAPAAQPSKRQAAEAPATGQGKGKGKVPAAEAPAKGKGKGKVPAAERAAQRERVAAERAEQERAQRERDEARKAARTAESAARRRAERAARALSNAQERHANAAQALAEAEQELADAREEAAEAAAAHERAQAELSSI